MFTGTVHTKGFLRFSSGIFARGVEETEQLHLGVVAFSELNPFI